MRPTRRMMAAFDKVAIPNITAYIIAFQVLCMMLIWVRPDFAEQLLLIPSRIVQGEWYRLVTFLFMPPDTSPLWAAFAFYFFWLMGSALESHWGTGRYNLYLLIAALMSMAAAMIPVLPGVLGGVGTNAYIGESVFLAFATLYPDYMIYVFFILPVRVKWLALLTWLLLGYQFVSGGWTDKALVIAAVANYLIFFWRDILERAQHGQNRMRRQVKRIRTNAAPTGDDVMNRCVVCNATGKSHPQYEFRYCSECGGKCYCLEHLRGHVHAR